MSPRLEFSPYRDSFEGHTECNHPAGSIPVPQALLGAQKASPSPAAPKCPLEAPAAPVTRPRLGREKQGLPEGSALRAGQPLAEALGFSCSLGYKAWEAPRRLSSQRLPVCRQPWVHGWVGRARHPLLQRGQAALEGGWGIPASSSACRCSPITEPRVWLRGAALRPRGPSHIPFHLPSPLPRGLSAAPTRGLCPPLRCLPPPRALVSG